MSEDSLNNQFAALHAQRVATMKPEDLAVNIRQREELVTHADRSRFPKAGDLAEDFTLLNVEGGEVKLHSLLSKGPAVLLFFRFATCPACNIALPYYQRQLYPRLAELGGSLVAISPQVPERLREIKDKHGLSFIVASDKDNDLARRLGIAFTANAQTQAHMQAKGVHLGEVTGTGTWELPMPAVIVIGQDGVVRFADVSPDWLVRTEANTILAVLEPAAA
ncbi:MAG TPA: peroxiredoxin-like family protein [Acidocella sp.]|nr:peroxiredoxin-like family protein [Acidocella sp.]